MNALDVPQDVLVLVVSCCHQHGLDRWAQVLLLRSPVRLKLCRLFCFFWDLVDKLTMFVYVRLCLLFQTFAGAGTNNATLAGLLRPLSDWEGFWTDASCIDSHIWPKTNSTHSQPLQAAGSTWCKGPDCSWRGSLKADCIKSFCMVLPFFPASLPHFSSPFLLGNQIHGCTVPSCGEDMNELKWLFALVRQWM